MSAWYDRSQEPLWRPSPSIERIVRESLVGGRVDTIKPEQEFEVLYEVDINSAYAWAAQRVPAGGCYTLSLGRGTPGKASYLHARIRANRRGLDNLGRLRLAGPLPVRRSDGRLDYPTEGEWEGWYWAEELDALRETGGTAVADFGFEWPEWSSGLRDWARRLHALRSSDIPEGPRGLIKLITVAGIGRLAGRETVTDFCDETDDGASPYVDGQTGLADRAGVLWPYFIRQRKVNRPELLPHIASYINAQVRLATWRKAVEEGEALVATNYDAVLTERRPNWAPSSKLGGWKWTALHPGENGLSVPYARGLYSAEKTRLPGTPRRARAA